MFGLLDITWYKNKRVNNISYIEMTIHVGGSCSCRVKS